MAWCWRLGRAVLAAAVVMAAAGCGDTRSMSAPPSSAAPPSPTLDRAFTPGRHESVFDVVRAKRTAIVVVPRDLSHAVPLVFVFHGHGGNGASIERRLGIEGLWPDAIVVYPDGLVGHKGITDPVGVRPGWQTTAGESGDRDVAFFDTMLAALRSKLPVDRGRVYLMGHSNGSQFVSLLLNQRGGGIAATANLSAAPPARLLVDDPVRSMFIAMGSEDPIVPYERQKLSIPLAERHLGVDPAKATVDGDLRSEPGPRNIELAIFIYPGGHEPPPDTAGLVVDFFKRHTLSDG